MLVNVGAFFLSSNLYMISIFKRLNSKKRIQSNSGNYSMFIVLGNAHTHKHKERDRDRDLHTQYLKSELGLLFVMVIIKFR